MTSPMLVLGRVLLASIFVISGVRKALAFAGTAQYMQSKGLPMPELLLAATIALEFAGSAALVFNVFAVPAALLLAAFCVVSGAIFHNFWAVDAAKDAALYASQLNHFLKNVSLAGGLLVAAEMSRLTSPRI